MEKESNRSIQPDFAITLGDDEYFKNGWNKKI